MKKDADYNDVSKSKVEFNQTYLDVISKNFQTMNQLCCILNGTKFNKVSSCVTTKEIWARRNQSSDGNQDHNHDASIWDVQDEVEWQYSWNVYTFKIFNK